MPLRMQSILWMMAWAVFFSGAMTLVKFVENVSTETIVFVRFVMSLVVFFPLVMKEKGQPFQTKVFPFHVLNAVLRVVALVSTYYAYTHLPMGIAASIGYTGPMVSILLAMVLLQEKVGAQKWIAVTLGYVGVLFMVEPNNMGFTIAILVALLANVCSSLAKITTKHLTHSDSPGKIMFYCNFIAVFLSGGYMATSMTMPPHETWGMLMSIGIIGSLSQYSYIRALSATNVSTVAPFEYLRLILAVPIGYFIFGEYLSRNDIIGGILIVGCSIFLVMREHQKGST